MCNTIFYVVNLTLIKKEIRKKKKGNFFSN